MKINSKVEFGDPKWHRSPEFDEGVKLKKRTIKDDLGLLVRSLKTLKGYRRYLVLYILIGITFGNVLVLVPFLERAIVDQALPDQDWRLFIIAAALIVLSNFADFGIKQGIESVIGNNCLMKLGLWMQAELYNRIQRLSIAKAERKGIGELMYRMHKDASLATAFAWSTMANLVSNVYTFTLFVIFMGVFDPALLWFVIIYEVFNIMMVNWIAKLKQSIDFYSRRAKELADGRMQQGFAGIETVKTFGRIKAEGSSFVNRVAIQMRVEMLRKMLYLADHVFLNPPGFFGWWRINGVQLFLMYQVIRGQITYGTVIAAVLFLKEMQKPMRKIISLWANLRLRIVPLERVLQIWDTPPSVTPPENPVPVPKLRGRIDVKDVRFSYEGGYEVLHGINLSVNPGEFIAVVGASGSGKSTLFNLLIRLTDPDSGAVLVDGIDLRKFDPSRYQNALGVVTQETFLSKETLR
ncbi:MAG: ATP-binding cassette domain-containing protein, partial [Chitinivibrionales bacterium]|nr:ATP-binding cassette domain-containing protein [Chitinivibrionales bacterium]MBD3357444.1 ATP-binding cassette domain-containing protein [Chitinivibrionales bacterium]